MWIKFSVYSLSTSFSSNSPNVLLVRPKSNTWVISWARMASGWTRKRLKLCKIGRTLRLSKVCVDFWASQGITASSSRTMERLQHLSRTLLKKNSFNWTPAAAQAFQTLKMAMCTTPVLALPDFTKTFVLECDASGKGIGTVLMQAGRPLAFTSKQLSEKNLGKPIYEKEMLAILHAVELWCPYLLGQRFQIKTDHQSLKYFLEQCISSQEQQKWVTKLFGYDYEIIYKKGKDNVVADALS
jgi:hypothetical protein